MKNSPYLDKPLRSEREARMEDLLHRILTEWPQTFTEDDKGYTNASDAMDALLPYIHEAKEILK